MSLSSRVDGLTKLAKLDFFVRYPSFFAAAAAAEGHESPVTEPSEDSSMVRYRYGPWDERYYQLLTYLQALDLITARREGTSIRLQLTDRGEKLTEELGRAGEFAELISHMQAVKRAFGSKSGTRLKNLIYELFEKEVGGRKIGEVIE